ncbi:hypothetical protein ACLOJK_038878, partial [Asimina triloba]
WNDELAEIRSVMLKELEWGQRVASSFLEFRQLLLGEDLRGVCVAGHRVLRQTAVLRPGGEERPKKKKCLVKSTVYIPLEIAWQGPSALDEE